MISSLILVFLSGVQDSDETLRYCSRTTACDDTTKCSREKFVISVVQLADCVSSVQSVIDISSSGTVQSALKGNRKTSPMCLAGQSTSERSYKQWFAPFSK